MTLPDPIEPTLTVDAGSTPLLYADLDGPFTGALMFRVGSGDEPLVRRGVTHLIEHMALSGYEDPSLQWNGFVDLNRTVFHATGPQERVEAFLQHVCHGLVTVDPARLERERRVLSAEARSRAPSVIGDLLSRRYGTSGWGAFGWWEMGLLSIATEDVRAWQRDWFTGDNAAVWTTGRPTPRFALDLPEGVRRPATDPRSLWNGPGWMRHDAAGVAALARADRSRATNAAAGAIVSEVHRTLREAGFGYSVAGNWHRLTLNRGALTLVSDVVPGRELDHVHALIDTIDRLAGQVPDRLLDERQTQMAQMSAVDEARVHLDVSALNVLLGLPYESIAAGRAEESALDTMQVTRAVGVLRSDLLMLMPPGVAPSSSRLPHRSPPADRPLGGKSHALRMLHERGDALIALSVGDKGLTLRGSPEREPTSLAWDDLSAVMRWHDGSRLAIDRRGSGIVVEPTHWVDGEAIVGEIDARVDPRLCVDVGSRRREPMISTWTSPTTRRLTLAVSVLAGLMLVAALVCLFSASTGGLVAAIALVSGAITIAWVTNRRPSPFVWDNGNTRTRVPTEFDRSTWYVPGGFLLGWAIDAHKLAPQWAARHVDEIAEYRAGSSTAAQIYRHVGGVLADDMLTDDANEFFHDYLALSVAGYDTDLARAFPGTSFFAIPDTVQSQQRVSTFVDEAFRRWRRHARLTVWLRLRRALSNRWPPQRMAWASATVQRMRRARWKSS